MTEWVFDDLGKPGSAERSHGLTLRNVSHKGYGFANEIGVAAIWINPNGSDQGKHGPFVLAGGDFDLVGGVRDVKTRAAPPFDGYSIERGVRQTYTLRTIEGDPVLGNELYPLSIQQTYRFSPYGADPPHEPTGALPAARIFPYVTFSTINPKVRSIRIDYRMNLAFTQPVPVKPDQPISEIRQAIPRSPKTSTGVFRDHDELPTGSGIPFSGQIAIFYAPTVVAKHLFAAAEKPVPYELLGCGLLLGVPGVHTWDNIHIWPTGKILPSTPGAFHAGHMHWRWARVASHPDPDELAIQAGLGVKAAGRKQFRGNFRGGPLVDPKIPAQTIRFAIAKREVTDLAGMETFETVFKKRGDPQPIKAGEDLDLWFSIEVQRGNPAADSVFGGTTLIHGLYFAHEVESKSSPFAFTAGLPLGTQTRTKWVWERNPPDD